MYKYAVQPLVWITVLYAFSIGKVEKGKREQSVLLDGTYHYTHPNTRTVRLIRYS